MSKPEVVVTCPKACLDEKRRMRDALDSILCLIGESEPDFCSPYQLREAIIKEAMKGLGKCGDIA